MLGNRSDPSQQAFAGLLRGLFHWKLDTSDGRHSRLEDIEAFAESEFAAIAESPSGPALLAAGVSENFPDLRCLPGGPGSCGPLPSRHRRPSPSRASGLAEEVAADAFNAVKKSDYMAF